MTTSLTTQDLGFDFQSPVYRFGALETTASNVLCVPIVYGQVKAAGNKIWQGSGTTTFNAVVAFAEGKINAISNVKLNDYPISELSGCSCSAYGGDGTQQIDSRVTGNTQADKAALVGGLKYTAYIALTVKASTKVANNYCNVTADIQGKLIKVYTNTSTYTTKYSNNPAWCIYDFLTCASGCGLSESDLDLQSFIDAAAYCDAKVGIETNSRFSLNLILDQRKSKRLWLRQMLDTCRGYLVFNANHKFSFVIEQDAESVQDFTPADIIKGSERFQTTPKEKRCDILKLRYIYPTEQCARVFAVAEADEFLSDPPIIQELQAFGVTNFNQASRLAWFYLNQANNCNKFISFATTQIGFDRMVGDVITLTSTFLGYVKKKMRIVQIAQAQQGQINIICREYNGAENATLTTSLTGTNNDLIFTSKTKNESANVISIKYTDPYANNHSLSVSVTANAINITLATNSSGAITTTATQLKAAIEANSPASALVTVAYATGNDGSGVVTAMAQTNLSGGTVGLYSDTMASVAPEINLININDNLDVPDDVESFSSAQNLNTIVLNWQQIDNTSVAYEIREGNSWTNSQVVAQNLTGSTHTVLNISKGTFRYWICAKNKYGTYSENAKSTIIIINEILDANTVVKEDIFDSDITQGTLTNCHINQNRIILDLNTTWASSSSKWDDPNMYFAPDGYYGADCMNTGSYTTKVYDIGADLSSIISVNYNLYSQDVASNVLVEWKYSSDNTTWTDWDIFAQGSYTFRYYQFRITLNSPNNKFTSLTSFVVNVDVPDRDLSFEDQVIANASTGVTVNFSPALIATPSVVANISDGTNGYCVVTSKSATQATIKAYDNSGTAITAKVDVRVKGY